MLAVNVLAASWTIRVLRWGTIAALIVFRRWRHLFVFLGAIIVLELLAYQIGLGIGRPRPLGVTILGIVDRLLVAVAARSPGSR